MKQIKKVSIINWDNDRRFMEEPFTELGYTCHFHNPEDAIPLETDLFFSFGYIRNIFLFLDKLQALPSQRDFLFVQWNTEGVPDLHLPNWFGKWAGIVRSFIGRQANRPNPVFLLPILNTKAHRFRYMGDYLYAYRHGLMQSLFDSSEIYVEAEKRMGLPAQYIPWGTFRSDYANLRLDRDIDVLWMGKPRGKRRNNLVTAIRDQMTRYGKKMIVIDGVEHPYVFGPQSIELFNRSKITLNLLPAWDAYNYIFKFHLAAGNCSLLVSEPFLKHNPEYIEGYHYVSASIDKLVDTLLYYCEHDEERAHIVENAYQLVTTSMTMTNSIEKIMSSIRARQ